MDNATVAAVLFQQLNATRLDPAFRLESHGWSNLHRSAFYWRPNQCINISHVRRRSHRKWKSRIRPVIIFGSPMVRTFCRAVVDRNYTVNQVTSSATVLPTAISCRTPTNRPEVLFLEVASHSSFATYQVFDSDDDVCCGRSRGTSLLHWSVSF